MKGSTEGATERKVTDGQGARSALSGANSDPLGLPIGARLKALRKASGVTLDSLAEKVGFTKGYLSKLETGAKVPPIATLAALAKVFGVDVATFLAPDQPSTLSLPSKRSGVSIVRADERPRVVRGGSTFGYDYQGLTHTGPLSKRMQPFIFRLPSQVLREVYFEHDGEELIFVLSGTIEIEIDDERHLLSLGDCIHFDATARHRARGVDGEATALVVILDARPRRAHGAPET